MQKESHSFQQAFFYYLLPVPLTSLYDQSFVKSNDLRLLVQIVTGSYLRMFTDPKTSTLHFVCKQKGQTCYDLQAYPNSQGQFYFQDRPSAIRHKHGCQLNKQLSKYVQIYNLMKLKNHLIEAFMRQNMLMQQSPSVILAHISNNQEEYFFQKAINYSLELKRKLRKRFDNIVNIDIKKIGKNTQNQPSKYKECLPKTKSQSNTNKKLQIQCKSQVFNANYRKNVQKAFNYREQDIFEESEQEESLISIKKKQMQVQTCIKTKSTLLQALSSKKLGKAVNLLQKKVAVEVHIPKTKLIYKQSHKIVKNTSTISHVHRKELTNRQIARDSIFILSQENQKPRQIYLPCQRQELPQLEVLNQQAEMFWSSSSQDIQEEEEYVVESELNNEDYFRSLRNSALKQSLEKESLLTTFGSIEKKQNCQ